MKRILILALLAISCEKEEPTPTTADCSCDRVMSHTTFNLPSGAQFGDYVTINDCSGVQENGSWNTSNGDPVPVNGGCY